MMIRLMTRMCFHIDISHPGYIHPEIDLGGRDIRMSEHFLYALDISSILKHMYCKRMSQCMWCNVTVNARRFRVALENFPESDRKSVV